VPQERTMDLPPGCIVLQSRQRDAANLGSQRASQRLDYHYPSL
jgi:hypothetical protein